ncbi:cation diffusion facilitator family transporter [Lishizhenia tianjinensis]|uniref:Cation diffusion facilitator family transporter n=1 Tax=Lishizhenia tianjinensis TaxID=477690 RepID=A0A1I6XWQ4_9FLAO|nr:cation diffusion facilitator family transporter [Lishizhenia tianjinensis]SFT42905.1 cation diffusion facilitator family transporter [Lishizhenia tianjinensis]
MREEDQAVKLSLYSVINNVFFAVVKGLAGVFGNSYALIADAIESTADVFSSLLVFFGLRYAAKPADENHPYGHGRIEPLISFFVVFFLMCSAFFIAYQSIINIQTPHALPEWWTLLVLLVIIAWKEINYRRLLLKSKALNSSALKAEAWHHRSDAITSLLAFIGISIALFFGEGFEVADDYAALVASGFIVYNSYGVFRPAIAEFMDEHLHEELEKGIRVESMKVKGVLGTEKCYIRKIGKKFHVDLHAEVDGRLTVTEGHTIAHQLQDHLKNTFSEIGVVLIHVEPFSEN